MSILDAVKRRNLVQLCLPLAKVKGDMAYPLFMSEKIDGVYALCVLEENGDLKVYSRTGEEYVSISKSLKQKLKDICLSAQRNILIGELFVPGLDQPTISGYARDTKEVHEELDIYLHDCLSVSDFALAKGVEPYFARYARLQDAMRENIKWYKDIKTRCVVNLTANTLDDVMKFAHAVWARGGEGVVCRPLYSVYEGGKRNKSMVKVKQALSFDLRVLGWAYGEGKYADKVGTLLCADRNGTCVTVGSGLTDAQRELWAKDGSEIVGKIVQIEAMCISKKGVLREPRFKCVRYDKMCEDIIQ